MVKSDWRPWPSVHENFATGLGPCCGMQKAPLIQQEDHRAFWHRLSAKPLDEWTRDELRDAVGLLTYALTMLQCIENMKGGK